MPEEFRGYWPSFVYPAFDCGTTTNASSATLTWSSATTGCGGTWTLGDSSVTVGPWRPWGWGQMGQVIVDRVQEMAQTVEQVGAGLREQVDRVAQEVGEAVEAFGAQAADLLEVDAGGLAQARTRARELLLEHLTEEQAVSYDQFGHVEVIAHSGRRFRLLSKVSSNLQEIGEGGRPVHQYCVHPPGVPAEDVMLTQLLMLQEEEGERELFAVANRNF